MSELARADAFGWTPSIVGGRETERSAGDDVVTPIDEYLRAPAGAHRRRAVRRPRRPTSWSTPARALAGPPARRARRGRASSTRSRSTSTACTGCKACVAACHSLNGLDEGEAGAGSARCTAPTPSACPAVQTVTHACHHCVDPACLDGCPANAYEKDPDTGIVRHLDDALHRLQLLHAHLPYEVPTLQPGPGHRPQVRPVQRPPRGGRGAGVRPGLPAGRDHHRRSSTWPTSWPTHRVGAPGRRARAAAPRRPSSPCPPPGTGRSRRCPPTCVPTTPIGPPRPRPHARSPSCSCSPRSRSACPAGRAPGWRSPTPGPSRRPRRSASSAWRTGLARARRVASSTSAGRCSPGGPCSGFGHSWLSREIVAFGAVRRGPRSACAAGGLLDLAGGPDPRLARAVTVAGGIAGVACSARSTRSPAAGGGAGIGHRTRFAATALACGGGLAPRRRAPLAAPDQAGAAARRARPGRGRGRVLVGRRSRPSSPCWAPVEPARPAARRRAAGAAARSAPGCSGSVIGSVSSARSCSPRSAGRLGLAPARRPSSPASCWRSPRCWPSLGEYHDRRLFFLRRCRAPHARVAPMSRQLTDLLRREPGGFGLGQVPAGPRARRHHPA